MSAHANHQQVVVSRHYDNAIGTSDAASEGSIRADLLRNRPALRPGELLEFVPGVIVTQHSGEGKANQYFLRGFNLDHGTDFAVSLNGMPLNLPTHAHGQGYSDLNLLIPEMVLRTDYRKGPYAARSGDFSLAGGADFLYRTTFDRPFLDVGLGQRGYRRAVAGGSTALGEGLKALGLIESVGHDGPWTVPEGLRRHNGVLTFSGGDEVQGWQSSLMAYEARWTATDQIPERLIGQGGFGRYDSLDPTAGGQSRRLSASGQWHRQGDDGSVWRVQAWAVRYNLDLYSNFTYALERPQQGDQFRQHDDRTVIGGQAQHAWSHGVAERLARTEVGLQWRQDRILVGLDDTVARRVTEVVRSDRVSQSLTGLYGQTAIEWAPWLRSVVGLRLDHLQVQVSGLSQIANSGTAQDLQLSPKLSVVMGPWQRTELFLNAGRGFHSNDARGATIRVDPRSGEPVERVPLLVAGRGAELGLRTERLAGLQSSVALWMLELDSELVYVGDGGATEPSLASRRRGIEWNNRYAPVRWLLIDADFAWSRGRLVDGQRIPNAVDRVASMAATFTDIGLWTASLQMRHLGSGPLTEDGSVRSRASTTFNARLSRHMPMLGPKSDVTLDVFNLTDRRVSDIQYFYESRLPGESQPVAGRHVHPAQPRTVRASVRWVF